MNLATNTKSSPSTHLRPHANGYSSYNPFFFLEKIVHMTYNLHTNLIEKNIYSKKVDHWGKKLYSIGSIYVPIVRSLPLSPCHSIVHPPH